MFGELVGVWLVAGLAGASAGRCRSTIAEIGPGRGTLMKDMLRTLGRLAPRLARRGRLRPGRDQPAPARRPAGRRLQDSRRRHSLARPTSTTLPAAPLLIVGNELFDALPVRQFVKTPARLARARGRPRRRRASWPSSPALASLDPALLPADADNAPDGAIFEIAPARDGADGGHRRAHRRTWRRRPVHRLRPSRAGLRRHVAGGAQASLRRRARQSRRGRPHLAMSTFARLPQSPARTASTPI